jgi:O-antigen/teichoic acid export membrane protein
MKILPRAVTRLGWSVADQALTSLANFALSAVVARTSGPADFGAFTIAFTAYLVTLSISRALATQPLLIRFSGASQSEWRRATSSAAGVVVVVGVVGGLGCLIAAWPAGGVLEEALVAVGVLMPGLLLWDIWRYAFFAAGRGRSAFMIDLVVAVVLLVLLGLITISGSTSLLWPTFAWGGTATAVAAATTIRVGVLPRPLWAGRWWHEQRDIAIRYAAEVSTDMLAGLMSYNGIAAVAGLTAVGALRASQLVLGPLNILLLGIPFVAIAEGARLLRRSAKTLRDGCLLLSAGLVTATLAWGAIALATPESLGSTFLGQTWGPARSVLVPAILATAGGGVSLGAWVGLRALGAARQSLRIRVIHSVAMLTFSLLGVAVGGTQGAAWGLAAAAWLGIGLWWLQFRSSLTAAVKGAPRQAASDAPVA